MRAALLAATALACAQQTRSPCFATRLVDTLPYQTTHLSPTRTRRGNRDAVALLLSAGADAAALGSAPLLAAAKFGFPEVVAQLLAAGADPGARDNVAVCVASQFGHEAVVRERGGAVARWRGGPGRNGGVVQSTAAAAEHG